MPDLLAHYLLSLQMASDTDASLVLACPVCGDTHTRFGGLPLMHPNDGTHESVRMLFYGDCGHQWVWAFMSHARRISVSLHTHTPR